MESRTLSSITADAVSPREGIRLQKESRQRFLLDVVVDFCLKTLCWHAFFGGKVFVD